MSKFSGKCDIYDMYGSRSDVEIENMEFYTYINGRTHRLEINSQKDLAKYYPNLIAVGCGNIVDLSNVPYFERQEEEHLTLTMDVIRRYINRLRKSGKDLTFENLLLLDPYLTRYEHDEQNAKIIFERLIEHGKHANIEGLHTYISECYRAIWYEHLVSVGYTENEALQWVYRLLWLDGAEIREAKERLNAIKKSI